MKTKVAILAGGKGKRFLPYSFVIPKPLMPINETPIIKYLINSFKKYSFKDFIISSGYKSDLIKTYLGNGKKLGVNIEYLEEKKPLGTAGPIFQIKKKIKRNDYFFLINGDIFTRLNFSKLISFAKKGNFELVVAYVNKTQKNSYGVMNIKNNIVSSIIEKPTNKHSINTGIYVIKNTKNLSKISKNKFLTMPKLIDLYLNKKIRVGAYKVREFWTSIENADNLLETEKKINKIIK